MRPSPPPTIGRIVHYQSTYEYPSKHVAVAGIITAVGEDDHVSLTLFFEGEEPDWVGSVPPAPDMTKPEPGTWFYPPRA